MVILLDGTILNADVGVSGNVLWIWMRDPDDINNNLANLTNLLSHREYVDEIVYIRGQESATYTGYNRLTTVKLYQGNLVSARMERGDESVSD